MAQSEMHRWIGMVWPPIWACATRKPFLDSVGEPPHLQLPFPLCCLLLHLLLTLSEEAAHT